MADSILHRLGWNTVSRQAEKRAAAEPRVQADAQKQAERDRESTRRGEAILHVVQSPDWWAVKAIFDETYTDLLDSLTGADDLTPDDILKRVGGLRVTRALYETFDADLKAGDAAVQRLTGGGRLVFIAGAERGRPTVAKQPLT